MTGNIKIEDKVLDTDKLMYVKLSRDGVEIEYYDSDKRAVINERYAYGQKFELHIESKVD